MFDDAAEAVKIAEQGKDAYAVVQGEAKRRKAVLFGVAAASSAPGVESAKAGHA